MESNKSVEEVKDQVIQETEPIKAFAWAWLHEKGFATDDMCMDSLEFPDVFELMRVFNQSRITQLDNMVSQLQKIIKSDELAIAQLEKQNSELRDALGVNDPWPVTDVLMKLVEATEYLLDVHNYDRLGWEEVSGCTKIGRKMAENILEALKPKENG